MYYYSRLNLASLVIYRYVCQLVEFSFTSFMVLCKPHLHLTSHASPPWISGLESSKNGADFILLVFIGAIIFYVTGLPTPSSTIFPATFILSAEYQWEIAYELYLNFSNRFLHFALSNTKFQQQRGWQLCTAVSCHDNMSAWWYTRQSMHKCVEVCWSV